PPAPHPTPLLTPPPPPDIYTLSLHDALPIFRRATMDRYWSASPALLARQGAARRRTSGRVLAEPNDRHRYTIARSEAAHRASQLDRKSTRLNSSHDQISYAVFCVKKKKKRWL